MVSRLVFGDQIPMHADTIYDQQYTILDAYPLAVRLDEPPQQQHNAAHNKQYKPDAGVFSAKIQRYEKRSNRRENSTAILKNCGDRFGQILTPHITQFCTIRP